MLPTLRQLPLILLLALASSVQAASQPLHVPAELIVRLFDVDDANRALPKRPFDLSELEALLSLPRFTEEKAVKDLTARYLKIAHLAGEVPLQRLATARLPEGVKRDLLKAPPGVLRFRGPSTLEDWLALPGEILSGISEIPRENLNPGLLSVDADKLLTVTLQRYQADVPYWAAFMRMRDAEANPYLFSVPSNQNPVGNLLDLLTKRESRWLLNLERCQVDSCTTVPQGAGFAMVKLKSPVGYSLAPGDKVEAVCKQAQLGRRKFPARQELELTLDDCQVVARNGSPFFVDDPLLKTLLEVR